MHVVKEISPERFAAYSSISPEFTVTSVLECEIVDGGLGGFVLREKPVAAPYRKYTHVPDEITADWATRFDLSAWGIFLAADDALPVGGAAVCPYTPGIVATQKRDDLAVLFDIRVAWQQRGQRVGTALFNASLAWARGKGFHYLSIETQNNNVPACRFYSRMGCELAEIRRFEYGHCPEHAHEAMLLWQLTL